MSNLKMRSILPLPTSCKGGFLPSSITAVGMSKPKMFSKHSTISAFHLPPSFPQPTATTTLTSGSGSASMITRLFHKRNGSGSDSSGGSRSFKGTSSLWDVSKVAGVFAAGIAYATYKNGEIFVKCACKKDDEDECCIPKKCEDSTCIHKLDCEEEMIRKANENLRKALMETKKKAVEATEQAIKLYCEAIELMQKYIDQGYCVINSDKLESPQYEEAWCCMYDISKKRCEKVREAIIRGQCAWALLCRLREIVETAKDCRYTSCNPLIPLAEDALCCGEKRLTELNEEMKNVGPSDPCMAKRFKEVLDSFKKDLLKEMECLPEDQKCEITSCQQEKAIMINMAHKKSVSLHKVVAHKLLMSGKIPCKQQETLC